MKNMLNEIGIYADGEFNKNGAYVIDIEDFEQFGKYYSLIDKHTDTEELSDSTISTIHNISCLYTYKDEFQLNLLADFDNDEYKLVVMNISKIDTDKEE